MRLSGAIRKPASGFVRSGCTAPRLDNASPAGERAQGKHLLECVMRSGRSIQLLCSLFILAPVPAVQGQAASKTVTVEGTVVDGAHAPIASAEVGLALGGG